jgi:hypothetical protein
LPEVKVAVPWGTITFSAVSMAIMSPVLKDILPDIFHGNHLTDMIAFSPLLVTQRCFTPEKWGT